MTAQGKAFCERYAATGLAMQSAIDVGYSERSAHTQASRLLKNVECAAYIATLQQKSTENEGVTTDWVVNRLKQIASGDMRKVFTVDGAVKPIPEWADNEAAMLAGFDIEEDQVLSADEDAKGNPIFVPAKVVTKKFKKTDAVAALKLLGDYTGAWKINNEQQNPIDDIDLSALTDAELAEFVRLKAKVTIKKK